MSESKSQFTILNFSDCIMSTPYGQKKHQYYRYNQNGIRDNIIPFKKLFPCRVYQTYAGSANKYYRYTQAVLRGRCQQVGFQDVQVQRLTT